MPDTSFKTGFDQDDFYDSVLQEKYCKSGERSREEIFRRVAAGLARVERERAEAGSTADRRRLAEQLGIDDASPAAIEHGFYTRFLHAQEAGFYPAGRIASACGTDIRATLINCFVQPVGDSISEDGEDKVAIYTALREAAETMRRGGGVGYDFSQIRPRGAMVRGTHSRASGPLSYMRVFDRSCETVESAGARRGAQMGVLRCDHPDIEAFVTAKDLSDFNALIAQLDLGWEEAEALRNRVRSLSNFNLSVAVTDALMAAVEADSDFELVHAIEPSDALKAEGAYQRASDGLWVYKRMPARALWDRIIHQTYTTAEPGVVFIDRMNADNNLWYTESIEATNPCVSADTWVNTSEGLRQVHELLGRPFLAKVNGEPWASGPEGFFHTGTKPLLRIRTKRGYSLRVTTDHPVLAVSEITRFSIRQDWRPAGTLAVGDMVTLADHSNSDLSLSESERDKGYLLGLLVGDGTIKTDKAVLSVWQQETARTADGASACPSAVMQAAESALRSQFKTRGDFHGWHAVRRGGRVAEYRMSAAGLTRLAESFGLSPHYKGVSPAIERAGVSFARGFLRGLFDADGSVQGNQQKGISVRLAQSDLHSLQAVQRMLMSLGIASTIYAQRWPARTAWLPNGTGGDAQYACKAQHELIVSGANLHRFHEAVGFNDEQKAAKLRSSMAGYRRALNRERFVDQIIAIEDDGIEPVYDVRIPGINRFDANGVVVHNCGEQPLPDYGCCCLGSINLSAFVRDAFGDTPHVDYALLGDTVRTAVRMLDDVLDATYWPLPAQRDEAMHKRRIGLGMTGLGTATAMMKRVYGSEEGVALADELADFIKRQAYQASVELAKEKVAFPAFDADKYLQSGFMQRMPAELREAIAKHGIRNSHVLSIAPTGTISLAFGRNVSNGIEPPFAWAYTRYKRQQDGERQAYEVQDRGYRLFLEQGGDPEQLPEYFVNAQTLPVAAHLATQAAVQKHVDSSISKTINVPADYDFETFKQVYADAFAAGCKGCTTYRPNDSTGAVLRVTAPTARQTPASFVDESDRRIRLDQVPAPALSSLRWPGRPEIAEGNPSWTYFVDGDTARFAVVIGHTENGTSTPFEVWVNGVEQPPGLGATAKLLSMDMRSQDRGWLEKKLDALLKTRGAPIRAVMPGQGEVVMASATAIVARLVKLRCQQLGAFEATGPTPVLDALMSDKEPKADTDGTMSWTVDVANAQTGDDFVLGLKELVMPDGNRRPYSVWLSGDYPRDLDGLCKLLSLDMRVIDPAWIGEKLRKLLNYAEPHGDFLARRPGSKKMLRYPSTVAYIAALMLHRYGMLGLLDEEGCPLNPMGVLAARDAVSDPTTLKDPAKSRPLPGAPCPDCGTHAVIKRDGCDACTACGWVGACG
ncbi:LAGLIDADG family homing endonuclease [Algiphilus sp.]|uniref:LAGLIDADG family homing endonuclease n=1 Tax=Algiphilus sp. TaxID=1872431 RepID=UPI0032F0622B